ncbi:PREDICTED: uncharacterized protein LOC104812733 [Tarenaya hassleriana]|uniref:uncharacterized protein LOC104812733 n=1 Tax=Tarenaya hassleriana TaxID=28532 RepID=UPI00053C1728|nr:PREDICTED: uncharacterized protein LOC104812733 [Tarenaya hassleriana]
MESEFPKSQIAGVQTVIPAKATLHRKVRPISAEDAAGAGIFRRTLDIVLYYKHGSGDTDSGWVGAGWIKESRGRALTEQPALSGRLRRRKAEEDGGGLEVVANDSGVRLVEAKFPASMPEFLELAKRDMAKAEAETLFWRDIDEDDPQFSPLFYVQVTNFECGGYSVGISCSILLADIIIGTDFIRRWSEIHSSILLHNNDEPTPTPVFYLPALKQDISYLSTLSTSVSIRSVSEPVVFRAKPTSLGSEIRERFASIHTEKVLGSELVGRSCPDVFLFVKEQGDEKLEVRSRSYGGEVSHENDDDGDFEESAQFSELSFWPGKRPNHSSCKIGSVSDGLVLVVPYPCGDDDDMSKSMVKMIVASPP